MNPDRVNKLNIALMLVAAVAAFLIPFELFLFSYAVLGPAHYLTEVSWLHDRHYFVKDRYDYRLLMLLCLPIAIAFTPEAVHLMPNRDPILEPVLFMGFFGALAMNLAKGRAKLPALAIIGLSALALDANNGLRTFLLIYLPTIVHVFVFTAAFILYGAIRSRSASGIASLLVFMLCTASFFVFTPDSSNYLLSHYVRQSYVPFSDLNRHLIGLFGLGASKTWYDLFYTAGGLTVARFVAFSYFYHYLNWFSKTSIIKWDQISPSRRNSIIVAWLAALAVYAYDYRIGFVVLTLMSNIHVFLEFPLDHQTFVNIGRELAGISGIRTVDAMPARARTARAAAK